MTLNTAAACGACSDTLPKQFDTIIARSDSWLSAADTERGGETRSAERQHPAAPPGAQRDAGRRSQALLGAARGAGEASAARASSRTLRPSLSAASPDRKVLSVSVSSGSRFYANIVAKLHRGSSDKRQMAGRRAFPAGVPATGARAPRAEGAERKLKPPFGFFRTVFVAFIARWLTSALSHLYQPPWSFGFVPQTNEKPALLPPHPSRTALY
jgi:hypothetical protein